MGAKRPQPRGHPVVLRPRNADLRAVTVFASRNSQSRARPTNDTSRGAVNADRQLPCLGSKGMSDCEHGCRETVAAEFEDCLAGGGTEDDCEAAADTSLDACLIEDCGEVPDGAEVEFCTYNLNLNFGDTFQIRDYVRTKGGEPVDWLQVFFTYTDAGASDPTTPEDWNLDAFNGGLPVTVGPSDAEPGTGNHGQGEYRIYIVRAGQAAFDDHMTIRVSDDRESQLEAAKYPVPCGTNADCDDGDSCTDDLCDAVTGRCGHEEIDCDDGNGCTTDSCDSASGCVHTVDAGAPRAMTPTRARQTTSAATTATALEQPQIVMMATIAQPIRAIPHRDV